MQGEITSSLNVMISAHENSKKQLLFANAAENQALAEAKRMQTEEARIATSERNIAEINANLTSPFLTEDPATTVSYSNPNRCVEHVFSLSVSLTVLQFFLAVIAVSSFLCASVCASLCCASVLCFCNTVGAVLCSALVPSTPCSNRSCYSWLRKALPTPPAHSASHRHAPITVLHYSEESPAQRHAHNGCLLLLLTVPADH